LPIRFVKSTASSTTAAAADAREIEQLVGAEAQNRDDLGIEAIDGAPGELRDQVIEHRPPALDAAGYLGGERAIALVRQSAARRRQGGGKVGAAEAIAQRMSYAATRAGAIMVRRWCPA